VKTLTDFIAENKIQFSARQVDSNPHTEDCKYPMDHWLCRFRHGGKQWSVYFSQGMGFNGQPPSADSVLSCLASDAQGVEGGQTFEEWCGEYGYDTDSRRALKTYQTVKLQAHKLRNLLGEYIFKELLYETETL